MSSLQTGIAPSDPSLSLQIARRDAPTLGQPQRQSVSVMRRYETAALLPDLTIATKTHIAPANGLFEECATAFARGTLITTVNGPVAIEDLLPGDYVVTANGSEPVTWIGSTTYVPGRDDEMTTLSGLVRITAESHGPGRPSMDLLVGPAARMIVRHDKLARLIGQPNVLAPVIDYADGDRVLAINPAGPVQLYHLMVRRHTTISVGGIEMETYHPGKSVNQLNGANTRALFLSLFQNISNLEDFGQVSLTRTTREVIDSLIDT